MKIIIVNNYARVTGGADHHCLELANGLRERDHQVAFISTYDKQNIEHEGTFVPTIVTRETRVSVKGLAATRVARCAIWNPSVVTATKELIASFRPDVVHAHKLYPQLSVAPVVVAATRGVPVIQTVHDYEFISASTIDDTGGWRDRDEEHASYRALNTALFGIKRTLHRPRVKEWISVSRSTAAAYREHGIETNVLPNFTDSQPEIPPPFGSREGIVFIGRLAEEKGLRHVLELAKHLPTYPIIIAGDGPLSQEVVLAAQEYPSISYIGKLNSSEVAQRLRLARLVVMPSLWREPGPLAALEAMSAGTPVIAYDTGGLAEYIGDASAGLVVPPSAIDMANAITSIYDDSRRWDDFSSNAREAVRRQHTLSLYLDRLEGIYTDAIYP